MFELFILLALIAIALGPHLVASIYSARTSERQAR